MYQHFLTKSLQHFKNNYNSKILSKSRDVTILAAAVVFNLLKQLKFTNLGIDDVCDNFYLKKNDILKYDSKIKC